MSINSLIEELKQNNQDFEFYPTTKEMIRTIYEKSNGGNWLDIGCGTCNFKKYYSEIAKEQAEIYERKNEIYIKSGYKKELEPKNSERSHKINNYYVIEKSQILLDKLDHNTIVLGTDFNATLLIDKPVENVFCNPPYSEFEEWTARIIREANTKKLYFVIPQRWKTSEKIQNALKQTKAIASTLSSFDFLDAERSARAKVDIVKVNKSDKYSLDDYDAKAFDQWFDDTYKMRDNKEIDWRTEEKEQQEVKNKLTRTDTSKAKILVDLYNEEMQTFTNHFQAICSLDTEILETIGVKKNAVKEALKTKALGTKAKYWKFAFNELDEVTERLTSKTRSEMLNRFTMLKKVDFTLENIYPMLLWVLKNANSYYNEQLITFFKGLTAPDNVKAYKSNQKVFERSEWRYNTFKDPEKLSHYTLEYRIIMSSPFRQHWHYGGMDNNQTEAKKTLQDIFVIARNLGFNIGLCDIPKTFGEKCTVLYEKSDKVFMEYRAYKNGNMHVKFDIEFIKAVNVEVSRLLGWIRTKEDIKKEFPAEMAKGAEKYFKQNYTCIGNNSLLLTTSKKPKIQHTTNKERLTITINQNYKECLNIILNQIDNFNAIIEDNGELVKKSLGILETQKGFIYRNCLISKDDNKTNIEFKEMDDFNKFLKAVT